MIFAEFFKGLFGFANAQIPLLSETPADKPEGFQIVPVDPEPLCTSAGLSVYSSKEPSLINLLHERRQVFSGMRLFQSEAIPMSTLTASTSSMAFGDVNVGSSSSQSFYLRNDTECPINYAINGIPTGFYVSPTSGKINAKSSVNISVRFSPTDPQYYSGYINPSPGSGSVSVTGTGKKN